MTFLPIADRELRVSARKRSTFWLRPIAAVVACVIAFGFFAWSETRLGISPGKALFATLTWLSLAATFSAGLFLTSDCLSEEKREGTLGLLFLTDLRGHDIILGKLLATSLQGICALLAIFPILAMTLLMGGVTGVQFWKTVLALLNALWISIAAGLFVSAISRESQKALAGTLLLLLLLAGVPALIDDLIAKARGSGFNPILTRASPVYLFMLGASWAQKSFWPEFFANQIVGWTLFAAACFLLPRVWQERSNDSAGKMNWRHAWKFGRSKARASLRAKLLELNPVLWLACRERWQRLLLTLVIVAAVIAVIPVVGRSRSAWGVWNFISPLFVLVIYLAIASQAVRLFAETKRNSFLELLLVTPVTVRQIVQGQWRGLLRTFGLPLALWLLAGLAMTFVADRQIWRQMTMVTPPAATVPVGTNAPTTTTIGTTTVVTTTTITVTSSASRTTISTPGFSPLRGSDLIILAIALSTTLAIAGNLAALSWFGMWMGLNSKTANLATLKTLVFVQIIPWFVITFASWMVIPMLMFSRIGSSGPPPQWLTWWPLIHSAIASGLALAKDAAFIQWSRRKLYGQFRNRALPNPVPLPFALPPKVAEWLKPYEPKRLEGKW